MKVLIVEDTIESANLLIRILTHAGYEVTHTISGLEGMRIARTEKPNVILLDFNLPDMDGSQICLTLRSYLTSTAMIAVTSNADRATRKKAEVFGFDAFVAKPVNIEELLNTIHTAVQHRENTALALKSA